MAERQDDSKAEFANVVQSHFRKNGDQLPAGPKEQQVILGIGILSNLLSREMERCKGDLHAVSQLTPAHQLLEALVFGFNHPINQQLESVRSILSSRSAPNYLERQKRALIVVVIRKLIELNGNSFGSKTRAQNQVLEAAGNHLEKSQPDNWSRKKATKQYELEISQWTKQFKAEPNLSSEQILSVMKSWLDQIYSMGTTS